MSYESLVDMLFKVITIISWIVGFIALTKARKSIKNNAELSKDIFDSLTANKKNQISEEEELLKMGKFLCDNCGAETPVRNAQNVDYNNQSWDLCPDCAEKLKAHIIALDQARKDYAEAEEHFKRAGEALGQILAAGLFEKAGAEKPESVVAAPVAVTAADYKAPTRIEESEKIAADSVLEALGLKK